MAGRQWIAVLAAAVVGACAATVVASCGEDDSGVVVESSSTGGTNTGGTTGTGTGSVTVDTNATPAQALDAAMTQITAYARRQTGGLVTASETLKADVDAGSVPKAKQAYAAARPYYERIEPLVTLFPELDGKIDAREDDFTKKANDPKWTGFHPIERDLWKDGTIDARTRALAAGLVTDTKTLEKRMETAKVTPEVVIPGTAELVDEVAASKITGEEERYSKLDLPTFVANLEGSRELFNALAPIVEQKDAKLEDQIDDAFTAAFAEVAKLRSGSKFLAYNQLTDAEQRAVRQSVEALAEPLARVQGTLGVKS